MPQKFIPPDGGWGWLIVLAYSVNAICTVPVMQGFGLLFKETCADLGMSATDISVIISVNSAFGMALGLINGPLLRYFGYRKIAIAGALCHAIGLTLCTWANSFAYFIIAYSIMCSLGTGIMNSAFSLALNSYFLKKRSRAVGLAMTLNGLGPILVPQLISVLISQYGARGAVAILGSLSLHALVGAFLLQPIRWHLKEIMDGSSDTEAVEKNLENAIEGENNDKEYISRSCENLEIPWRKRTMTMSSIDHDVDTGNIYGFDTSVPRKKSTSYVPVGSAPNRAYRRSSSENNPSTVVPVTPTEPRDPDYKWWSSGRSLETVNLGSSVRIFDESRIYKASRSRETFTDGFKDEDRKPGESQSLMQKMMVVEEEEDGLEVDETQKHPDERKKIKEKKKPLRRRICHSIIVFFDLDLLRDPIYVDIMLGMSIAIFAELNFSLLTPFILSDMKFNTEQIAIFMSCLASSDLIFRGLSPFIAEWLDQTPRIMYLIGLVLLIITRSALFIVDSFTMVIIVGFGLGIAKGIRSVFMTLVISNYVPIEKLASASGIQMVTNGLTLVIVGPILGVIRDKTGSYDMCLIFINGMTALTVVMWTAEIIICKSIGKMSKTVEKKNGNRNKIAERKD